MQFEGTQVNIPIKGIMRAGTDNLSADGAMNEVIGMEYKDGSWLPYIMTEEGVTFTDTILDGGIKKVYVHKTSDGNSHYVVISTNNTLFYEYDRTGEDQQILLAQLTQNVSDIEFVGNMLCVSKESGLEYYLWQDNNTYIQSDAVLTGVPKLDFKVTKGIYNKEINVSNPEGLLYTTYGDGWGTDVVTENEPEQVLKHTMIGAMSAVRGELSARGGLTGYFLVCYAYRLKNGELTMASSPILMSRPMTKIGGKIINYDSSRENPDFKVYIDNEEVTLDVNIVDENSAVMSSPILPSISQGKLSKMFEYIRPKIVNGMLEGYDFSSHPQVFYGTDNATLLLLHKDGYQREGSTGYPEYTPLPINGSVVQQNIYNPAPGVSPLSCTAHMRQATSEDYYRYQINAYALSNKLQMRITSDYIPEDSEIQSVCVFMSQEIDPFESLQTERMDTCIKDNFNDAMYSAALNLRVHMSSAKLRNADVIIKELREQKSVYLIKEISIGEYNRLLDEHGDEWFSIDLEGILGDTLVTREQLPLTAFDYTKTFSGNLSAYNYRLHHFDYKQSLFSGYSIPSFSHNGGLGQYAEEYFTVQQGQYLKWEAKVVIKNEDGETRVTTFDNNELESLIKTLSPIIVYPDKNAESITIAVYYYPGTSSPQKREQTFYFSHDGGLGLAYYIDPELKPIVVALAQGDVPSGNLPSEDYQPYNIERIYHNGLKVSDVAYPSYFPAKYTYRIGNERIIGLARLTIPVSQDNYGADRLIVFCTDGIYSMGVDRTGSGVYTDTQYSNPEVCVNANSICEIGGAVIFASDKGLMMLSSNGVEEFTPHLNGEIRFRPDNTGQYIKDGQHIYNKMVTDPLLTELSGSLSTQDFIDYLHEADTVVSYISKKNMLVVYNKNKTYIYLIDIATRNTTKLDICIAFDDDNSPVETYFVENVNTWTSRVFGYRSQEGSTDCLIQSRPIKIQQDDKCSYRLVVTGYFEGAENTDKWAGLIVLGGLDGDHWQVIGVNNECLDEPFHNIGCVTNRGSWKYLMFIFAGHLSTDSHIDSIDITVESKYRNKKR